MIRILRENNDKIKTIPAECVKGATLLSVEEVENLLTQKERKCKGTQEAINNGLWAADNGNSCYWLRSAGYGSDACGVSHGGDVNYYYRVGSARIGVRPALILNLQSSNLRVGDAFEFGDYTFKVISNRLALCDIIIDACPFNNNSEDGNNYETSNVKIRVDKWFNETMGTYKGIRTDAMIEDENDFGF